MKQHPKLFLSYSRHNKDQADTIDFELKSKFNIKVTRDIRDIKHFGSIRKFMNKVRESDFVVKLISKEYLESENCMYEVLEFIKDDTGLLRYLDRTIPIILPNAKEGEQNIFTTAGKLYWTKYWAQRHKELYIEYKDYLNTDFAIDNERALREIKKELDVIKTIAECISNEFLTYICSHRLSVSYHSLLKNNYSQILHKIKPNIPKVQIPDHVNERQTKLHDLNEEYKFISIIDSTDPQKPEFPPDNPKFPATPVIKITVPKFTNVWLKDESVNPTGTHKDRLAHEVIRKIYKPILKSNIVNEKKSVPHLSLISSGSAAVAIQHLLNKYNFPCLKVLTDFRTSENIIEYLKNIGCEVYLTDLSKKALHCNEILKLTQNKDGIDISSRDMLDPINYVYYDWLSYEILNIDAKYYFIPFGTGDLFSNVLNISVREYFSDNHDKRLTVDSSKLSNFNIIGVTTKERDSILDKLYSPFLPFSPIKFKEIERYKRYGACGSFTTIGYIDEKYVSPALEIAKNNNITCEPSGIAGLAMLLQMEEVIQNKSEKILIVNTGKLKFSN